MNTALLIIDIQNDYFPGGKYPLWNTDNTLSNILKLVDNARQRGDLIIHVQHIANPEKGISPFFNKDTAGVDIHSEIKAAAPDAPVVIKEFADSFEKTGLEDLLAAHSIERLVICGMMTQNCVTHTAISKATEKYDVTVLADCSTTVDEMIHNIALNALSTRVDVSSIGKEYS